jgi:carbonic anhydrase
MQKIIAPVFAFLLIITFCSHSIADIQPKLKNRVGIPPFQVIKDVMSANQKIKNVAVPFSSTSAPYLTWLADPDPRIYSELIISSRSKGLYEVRNLANQLSTSIAAVDYGVRYLHSPILLITGNTDSEAIRLFQDGYGNVEESIRLELDHLHLPLAKEKITTRENETKQDKEVRLVETNVDFQTDLATRRYSDRIKAGRLVVVGSVLDLNNHYGMGSNKLIIINVNGEKDAKKLRKLRVFSQLDAQMRKQVGRKNPVTKNKKGAKK